MTRIHRLKLEPPILNSSCLWASSLEQLEELYACKFTGGVTTRTATLSGFAEDSAIHKHALVPRDTSINSYGYSPNPLAQYLTWIREILADSSSTSPFKPIIISLAPASPRELSSMLDMIQELRHDLMDSIKPGFSRIGVELNTSCPNILGHDPPAYAPSSLIPLLHIFRERFELDPTLTIGLKLAPYVYSGQFQMLMEVLASLSTKPSDGESKNCIAFLTCTNTLGSSVIFQDQEGTADVGTAIPYALPTVTGGLAGEPIHALALGNIYTFRKLLSEHPDRSLQRIAIIGVGGVASPEAVGRMFGVGATAVACATALGTHGITIFESLNGGL